MEEFRSNFKALIDGSGTYAGNNGEQLLELDLDSIALKIEELEEKIEELEARIDDGILTDEATIIKAVREEFTGENEGKDYICDMYADCLDFKGIEEIGESILNTIAKDKYESN